MDMELIGISIRRAITDDGVPPTIDGVQVGCVTEGLIAVAYQLVNINANLEKIAELLATDAGE